MFYKETSTQTEAKPPLIERRTKYTPNQIARLEQLSEETGVPFTALVRMAVNSFLPKMGNMNYTAKGIKEGYNWGGDR